MRQHLNVVEDVDLPNVDRADLALLPLLDDLCRQAIDVDQTARRLVTKLDCGRILHRVDVSLRGKRRLVVLRQTDSDGGIV